jgi:plasmid stabilization system protein ParE
MAKSKIIWSRGAKKKLYAILEFYIRRDKSKLYSVNLYRIISKEIKLLLKYPEIGEKTTEDPIRGYIINSMLICYEFSDNNIVIHTIFDNWKNPGDGFLK